MKSFIVSETKVSPWTPIAFKEFMNAVTQNPVLHCVNIRLLEIMDFYFPKKYVRSECKQMLHHHTHSISIRFIAKLRPKLAAKL